jgi:hypothetical protein
MPSEKIHRTNQASELVSLDPNASLTRTIATRECVTVQWLPDRDVSVGIELQSVSTNDPSSPAVDEHSAWMTLSRAEINRLIKALRRARDAAYGRDE